MTHGQMSVGKNGMLAGPFPSGHNHNAHVIAYHGFLKAQETLRSIPEKEAITQKSREQIAAAKAKRASKNAKRAKQRT